MQIKNFKETDFTDYSGIKTDSKRVSHSVESNKRLLISTKYKVLIVLISGNDQNSEIIEKKNNLFLIEKC